MLVQAQMYHLLGIAQVVQWIIQWCGSEGIDLHGAIVRQVVRKRFCIRATGSVVWFCHIAHR